MTTPEQMRTLNRLLIHHTHDTTESVDRPAYVRGLVKDLDRTWTDGIVYYKISDGLGKKNFISKIKFSFGFIAMKIFSFLQSLLGLVQASNFSCAEPNVDELSSLFGLIKLSSLIW